MTSILKPWVTELPLRAQGTVLTCIRGCDLTPKYPLDSIERQLVGAIRFELLNPADLREVDIEPGCFFLSNPPMPKDFKCSIFGHYPWHYVSHLVHTLEILGYFHPDENRRLIWRSLYNKFVFSFHFSPESKSDCYERLTEDRIKSNKVVS